MLILGHGSIGKALEARLAPFGARVRGIARTPRPGVSSMAGKPLLTTCACKQRAQELMYL